MASNTRETWKRRMARRGKAGRKRKNQDARHSTPSNELLFAGMGEPGQPAPKPVAAKSGSKPGTRTATARPAAPQTARTP